MSNFFAALDSESDDDVKQVGKVKAVQSKNAKKKKAPKAPEPVAKPSNENKRGQDRGSRNDNKKRTGRGGKREYDRRSGTGRGREMKKGGAGGHNWGKAGDENTEVPASKEDVETEEGEAGVEKEVEPEVVEKTLDEYFAEKAALRQGDAFEDLGDVEVEGVKDGKEYAKKDKATMEEVDSFMATTYSKQKRTKSRKDKPKQVETGFYVKDKSTDEEPRAYRGRGGRGRRGGGGRGRGRGGRGGRGGSTQSFVDSNNVAAFPALGASN